MALQAVALPGAAGPVGTRRHLLLPAPFLGNPGPQRRLGAAGGLPVRHLLGPWAAGKAVLGVAEDGQLVTLAGQSTPVICPWSCDEQDGFWSDKARRRLTEVWAGKDIVMMFLEEVAPCGYLRVRFQYCRSLESRCLWRLMSVEAE